MPVARLDPGKRGYELQAKLAGLIYRSINKTRCGSKLAKNLLY
jgi:hypothetical protein